MDYKTTKNLKTYGGEKFDFGSLNDEHTKAVKEACEILTSKGVDKDIINDLQLKFNVKELPKYELTKSPFFNFCKKDDISISEQGNITVNEDGKTMLYPVAIVCEDIRKLDKLFENIFNAGIKAADQIKK
jgi:hypothetical protein|tara:strand:+ start:187 stop:576 length:390 start_codon:yes stop_codon:yes gene_type:complete